MDKNALMINVGSSSLKAALYELSSLKIVDEDHFKEIDTLESSFEKLKEKYKEYKIVYIGHRIVHGGYLYTDCQEVTDTFLTNIEKLIELAPLHNPFGIEGILSAKKIFGESVKHYALFDTAFHKNLPFLASSYALEKSLIEKYHIRRYGFHGFANQSAKQILIRHLRKIPDKTIIFHLGSGASMSALKNGESIDTSMGFTPNEGLVMATRSGDIDPGLVEYIAIKENLSLQEVGRLLNKKSGLWGFSSVSKDMSILIDAYHENRLAKNAVDLFCYRILKYFGSYLALLKGVDTLIFSGGIGENSPFIREKIISSFDWLGIELDFQKNSESTHLKMGDCQEIHSEKSAASLYVIAVDENIEMAKQLKFKVENE